MSIEQVEDAEARLAAAMLASDVIALTDLLAKDLIFTNHLGQILGRKDDLAAYRDGLLRITSLQSSQQHIRILGDAAVVSVRMQIRGTYAGHPADGAFRFTRVWARDECQSWQVVAAHAVLIAD